MNQKIKKIIHKNYNLIELNQKEEHSLNNKNFENIDEKKIIKEIKLENKECSKMNNIIDENELNNKNQSENSNNNIYTLLNTYYKDIDFNFKNGSNNNNCKNFMHKNYFQENINKNNFLYFQNNMQNTIPYLPYMYNQNQGSNNPFTSNGNKFQSNYFPENFTINNEYNYYIINNVNKYSYNSNNNENKKNKKRNYNFDPKFFAINLDNILKGIDTRTTIMIRHIPNKYSYQNILDEINFACKDKYDLFYLPIDSENNCNLGYSFINFIHPLHIIYFYNMLKSRKWLYYNSYKECDLSYAKYQGNSELTNNILSDEQTKKPMIFEIKNPPKINLFIQYYETIKKYQPELLNQINWIYQN